MTHKPRPSAWFTRIVGLALLAGCQSPRQAGSLVTAAQAAPGTAPSQAPVPQGGIGGVASLLGENFAGADVKVYKPGQTEPVGTGTTRADGTFTVALDVDFASPGQGYLELATVTGQPPR